MKIAISNPEFYFAFFYVLAFLLILVIVIYFSNRNKIPLWSVLLMLTTVSLCTIVGSRLSTMPVSEWSQIIRTGRYEGYRSRFAVGGLLFGLAGLLFSKKILGINNSILSLYAWIAPLGFGIQKIGCFLNGCCYGKPSELPWSIQYPINTSAHFHQVANGMIDDNAIYSLGVQPVQLYEVICLFAISYIVWRTQKSFRNAGSSLIFSLCLFFAFRFSIGFLRDNGSSGFNATQVYGITIMQWFFLLSGIVCAILLILFEKRVSALFEKSPDNEFSFKKSIIYILTVSLVIFVFRGLFTPFELLSLNLKFIPAILLTAYYVYKSLKTARYRLVTASISLIPLFIIIQTIPPDTTKTRSKKDYYQDDIKSYQKIDIGLSLGEYNNSVRYDPQEGECGTLYSSEDYSHLYRMAETGYSKITIQGNSFTTWGVNLYGGINHENNLTKDWEKSYFLFGINPYIKYDYKWAGYGGAVHIGNIRWIPGSPSDKSSFDIGTWHSPIMPGVYFRLGRTDILDLKYTYGFNFPTTLPLLSHEVSLGSGIGEKTDYCLRIGTAMTKNYAFPFISAEGLIGKNIGISIRYDFGNGEFYEYTNQEFIKNTGRIQFGANYRFGFKK